ncbi:MAG: hypothetical protein RIR96_79 [Bacteroidota bacterium]|jgi:hypothetical protein
MAEYRWLLKEPVDFFLGLFQSPYDYEHGNYIQAFGAYWKDLANNLVIKLQAVFNILTKGYYPTNALLMNSIGFMGSVAIYRTFIPYYPKQKIALIFSCFLIPTTLYFTSGIHKDLFVFTSLGFLVYATNRIGTSGFTMKRLMLLVVSLITIGLFRNFLLVCILPCLIAYFICLQSRIKPTYIYSSTFLILAFFVLTLTFLKPEWSPWNWIVQKQHDFLALKTAGSQLPMEKIENNGTSIIRTFPMAVNHGFFRPYFWGTQNPFAIMLGLELYFFVIIGLAYLFQNRKKELGFNPPIIGFAILCSVMMIITIGYIVPNGFSIVRYRSIYLPFIITPILAGLSLPFNRK